MENSYSLLLKAVRKVVSVYCRMGIYCIPQSQNQLYWDIGKAIVESKLERTKELFVQLAKDLKKRFLYMSGLSASNLANTCRFYENYCYLERTSRQRGSFWQKLSKYQAIDGKKMLFEIPWSRHRVVLKKKFAEREFYLFMCHKWEWDARELKDHCRRQLYSRYRQCAQLSPPVKREISTIFTAAGLSVKTNLAALQIMLLCYIRFYDWLEENPLPEKLAKKLNFWEKLGIWPQLCDILERELLTVANSPVHNRGLFAQRDIPAYVKIIEYRGECIDAAELERREQRDQRVREYLFCLHDDLFIDGTNGNIARYINHSCDPNCFADGLDGKMWIVSRRDICRGEELSFDYGYRISGFKNRPCRCGAKNCFGYIVSAEFRDEAAKLLN